MRLAAFAIAAACLAGCGNKGPLYLPESKPQAGKPPAALTPAPTRAQPPETLPSPQ
jgi:predicted small lipoprotein YifL